MVSPLPIELAHRLIMKVRISYPLQNYSWQTEMIASIGTYTLMRSETQPFTTPKSIYFDYVLLRQVAKKVPVIYLHCFIQKMEKELYVAAYSRNECYCRSFFCFRHDDTHYLHFLSLSVEYMIMLTLSSHRNAMKFG